MSLAYFDDVAVIFIKCGDTFIRRTVERVKVDYVKGEKEDTAVLYIPLYGCRSLHYTDESVFDESDPRSSEFTVRVGDKFDFYNTNRNGSTPIASVGRLTVTAVQINTRGSHRMRHIRAVGKLIHESEEQT